MLFFLSPNIQEIFQTLVELIHCIQCLNGKFELFWLKDLVFRIWGVIGQGVMQSWPSYTFTALPVLKLKASTIESSEKFAFLNVNTGNINTFCVGNKVKSSFNEVQVTRKSNFLITKFHYESTNQYALLLCYLICELLNSSL